MDVVQEEHLNDEDEAQNTFNEASNMVDTMQEHQVAYGEESADD